MPLNPYNGGLTGRMLCNCFMDYINCTPIDQYNK